VDGIVGFPLILVADLPGQSVVRVNLYDPLGNPVISNDIANPITDQRWSVVVGGERVTIPGFWRAEFQGDSARIVTDVIVGHDSVLQTSVWTLVTHAAAQYDEVGVGYIDAIDADGRIRVSDLAYGEQYWRGRFLTVHPEDDLGNGLISRRIAAVSEDGFFTLVAPFPGDLRVGARCAVLPLPVHEVLRALAVAVSEYGKLGRVPVSAGPFAPEGGKVQIPRGWTHITEVWAGDKRLRETEWALGPNRTLDVGGITEGITIRGLMPQGMPSQPLGFIVVEPTVLVSYAGSQLHLSRASGPGIDIEEHMRRHVLLMQLAEASLPRLAGRVPHGAREVIP